MTTPPSDKITGSSPLDDCGNCEVLGSRSSKEEAYPEIGLTIQRGALDRELAYALESDCRRYMKLPKDEKNHPEHRTRGLDSPYLVRSRRFCAEELMAMGRPATTVVLTELQTTDDHLVAINRQPAYSNQAFHRDYHLHKPVWIIHASPDGGLDHAIGANTWQEAEEEYDTLTVGAGDLVGQHKPWILHRGSNVSQKPRYTMVVYRPKGDFE